MFRSRMSLLALATLHFFAVISPGPDTAVVIRNAISYSRKNGLLTAFGITVGNLLLIGVSISGASLLVEHYPQVLKWIQIAGSLYLGWIGFKAFRVFFRYLIQKGNRELQWNQNTTTHYRSFQDGLVTTLSNPKAIVYFISIASQFLTPGRTFTDKILLVTIMVSVTMVWFSTVSVLVGHAKVRQTFLSKQYLFEGAMGVVLILFCVFNLMRLF